MDVKEIPKCIFDEFALVRTVELHRLIDTTKQDQNPLSDPREFIIATCDMENGVWLQLRNGIKSASLEVIRSDSLPFDPANPAPAVYGSRTELLARLSTGSSNTSEYEGLFFSSTLGSVALRYPFELNLVGVARIMYAAPIIGEIARRTTELLSLED